MVDIAEGYNLLSAVLACLLFALLFVCGCGDNLDTASETQLRAVKVAQKAGEPGVLVVGGETMTCDDIIQTPIEHDGTIASLAEYLKPAAQASEPERFKDWARLQVKEAVVAKISSVLLYQAAKRQAGENVDEALEKAAEAEWRRFMLPYGGDEAKAEEELRKMGLDRQSFKERQKRLMLTQSYIASKLPANRPITFRELVQCYNQMKDEFFAIPGSLQFRLIDIQLAKVEILEAGQDPLERARELGKELVRRIDAGGDFAELANQYSHGPRRELGGLWKPIQPDSLAKPYDALATEAEKMEVGEIAGPIEAEGHIFVMKLEAKRAKTYEPLENVQEVVQRKIIVDRRKEAINELEAELMEQAALSNVDEFVDICVDKIHEMSRQ